MKYTYSIETLFVGKWCRLSSSDTRDFCYGYMTHASYCSPRNAMRVVRSDGKIMAEHDARAEVDIGMIASWPSAEQYEAAAAKAIAQAARIRAYAKNRQENSAPYGHVA